MDKGNTEILLLIIGLIVTIAIPVFIYKKQQKQSAEIHRDDQESASKGRINSVVKEYFNLANNSQSSLLPGLIRSGMATLQNEEEAREVIRIISKQTRTNPLTDRGEKIEQIGILKFFQNFDMKKYREGKLDETIEYLLKNK